MRYFPIVPILLLSFAIQGCGGSDGEEARPSAPPEPAAAESGEVANESWFDTIDDSKSEAAIFKSPGDDRAYRYRELENGLQVLLVSDPDADKAAASLSIDIGSFENPPEREGLAHFLEHMLFLGTDKYPEPGEYQAFLTEHGGSFNAYTSMEETNYFFDIDSEYLVQTLDRFARFFVAPLFNEEYVDRERHAVDSEYQLRIKDDGRREWDVLRELANPEHPFSLFSVGSLETLENTEENPVREDLIDFYEQYYTASRMNLVVLGNEPLDELDGIVRERFSPVPTREVTLEESYTPLFETELPVKVAIKPEKEIRALSFNFPMPSLADDWRTKPAHFLGHLLGHEGEGSLLALLRDRDLAEGLSSGLVFDSRHGALFSVRIKLTPRGVVEQDLVSGYFFRWLELVKEQGLQAWRYDEVARMNEIDFRFLGQKGSMGYVRRLATSLHDYTPEEILRGGHLFTGFDESRLKEITGYLRPDNVAIVLTAPDVETDRETELYGAPYAVEQIPVADLKAGGDADDLQLPEANPYIPENLALINPDSGQREPQRLEAAGDGWLLATNPYGTPKAFFEAKIAVPGESSAARAAAMAFILALAEDELSSEVYPARLAGLHFSLRPWERGYDIRINGFDEKQALLLERILQVLKEPDWDEQRVERVRKSLLREWRNTTRDWPLRQLFARFPTLLKDQWLPVEKADQLEGMTLEEIRKIHSGMTAGISGRFYAAGNLAAENMATLTAQVNRALEPASVRFSPRLDILDLAPTQPLAASRYHVDHADSAALLYLQGAADNLQERATFALLEVMASAPFYSSLRTEKQLGYAVGSSTAHQLRVPGMMFYVQSPKVDAETLREEIDGFFATMAPRVAEMTKADLTRYKNSVLASIQQKPVNLQELAQRHLESLNLGFDTFDFREQLAAAVRAVTLEQFQADFTRVLQEERAGFWILTSGEEAVGTGEAIPDDHLEGVFSHSL